MGMKFLVDSNVIIYHLNGNQVATDFLRRHINECAISQVTYLEVMSFSYSETQANMVQVFLDMFVLLDVTKDITLSCIKNRRIKKIKVPDNIIASTAQRHNLILVTHNVADFAKLDITTYDPITESTSRP